MQQDTTQVKVDDHELERPPSLDSVLELLEWIMRPDEKEKGE